MAVNNDVPAATSVRISYKLMHGPIKVFLQGAKLRINRKVTYVYGNAESSLNHVCRCRFHAASAAALILYGRMRLGMDGEEGEPCT